MAETPADLAGLRVGVPGRFGASYSGLLAFLAVNGMTEADIDLQEIGFNAPEVMCVGGVDAAVIYVNNEPLQIRERAAVGMCGDVTGVDVFPVADDADLVSNGIVTGEAKISENPDEVRAFVAAFDRALRDVLADPFAAYTLSSAHIESLPYTSPDAFADASAALAANPDQREAAFVDAAVQLTPAERLQFAVLLESLVLWQGEQQGVTEAVSWELTQDTLINMGFLGEAIDLDAAYTNDFLPDAGA